MPRKKASTQDTTPAPRSRGGSTPRFIATVLLLGVVVVGGAAYLGMSDSGQININTAISDANRAEGTNEDGTPVQQVSTVSEAFQSMPNGGLVPAETVAETSTPAPEEEVPAATTDAVAPESPDGTPGSDTTTEDVSSTESASSEETADASSEDTTSQ